MPLPLKKVNKNGKMFIIIVGRLMMKKYKDLLNGKFASLIELLLDLFVLFLSLMIVGQVDYLINSGDFRIIPWNFLLGEYRNTVWMLFLWIAINFIILKSFEISIIKRSFSTVMANIVLALFFVSLTNLGFFLVSSTSDLPVFLINNWYLIFLCLFIQIVVFSIYKGIVYLLIRKYNRRYVLLYGPRDEVLKLAKSFLMDKQHYKILKYICFEEEISFGPTIERLLEQVNDVFVTSSCEESNRVGLMNYIQFKTYKELYFVPLNSEINLMNSKFDQIDETLLLRADSMHLSFENRFIKRSFDIIVSVLLLTLAFIPMLIIALIIKLQDGGPVFFRQERYKRKKKRFSILKFRSMKVLKQGDTRDQDVARTTKFGKFIRATRLDELPQLINILKGDMSLVGPRPMMIELVEEAILEDPTFEFRANVKPGLTGLAQVKSYYTTPASERLRYDLYYVRNQSFFLDIKICLQTVITMFNKEQGLGRDMNITVEEFLSKQKRIVLIKEEYGYLVNEVETNVKGKR